LTETTFITTDFRADAVAKAFSRLYSSSTKAIPTLPYTVDEHLETRGCSN